MISEQYPVSSVAGTMEILKGSVEKLQLREVQDIPPEVLRELKQLWCHTPCFAAEGTFSLYPMEAIECPKICLMNKDIFELEKMLQNSRGFENRVLNEFRVT